jgi:hypothetical protein
MRIKAIKFISLFSCLLVSFSVLCVPAGAAVQTSTSGVHVEPQVGKDGKTYMIQVKDPGPQITIDETKIVCPVDPSEWIKWRDGTVSNKTVSVRFEGYLSKVDTKNKCLIINFGGDTGDTQKLKDLGIKILNPAGAEITYWDDGICNFKIPYSDISFVKEMYITYGDQKVKMTVA